MLNELHVI